MGSAELNKNKKIRTMGTVVQSVLILILMILVILLMSEMGRLQGTARVINYAGLVRGATQREVKLEITGYQNDELIQYLDDILNGLKYGDGNYNLVTLDDTDYNKKLDAQIEYWGNLKRQIRKVRELGYEDTDIVEVSETYFDMADETVFAAENYSVQTAGKIRALETASAVDMLILVILMIMQMVSAVRITRKNKILEQKVYIDLHTGLPNKSRCEEIFHDMRAIKGEVACIIFDLNNLKITNDTLGHSVGDQLIMNFARLLRNVVPMKNFVGRYGGDEFVVVICDTSKKEVENILNQLQEEVDQFNRYGRNETISYAYGWAFSKDYTDCTLRVLFDKADHYMYENKRAKKEASKNE